MNLNTSDVLPYKKTVLGTAGLGGVWRKINPDESVKTIIHALESGIAAIDTAPAYGDAEYFVGTALKHRQGLLPTISTKVGRLKSYATDDCHYDYSQKAMIKSVEDSLRIIGVDKIDILFLHEPSVIQPAEIERILEQMLWFKEKGYATKIGLGGNPPEWLFPYLSSAYFDVIMEHNKLNACCLDAIDDTLPICEAQGIEYYNASPLNMGLLGSNFNAFVNSPPYWLGAKSLEQAQRINDIAQKYQCPLTDLAHRFLLNFKIPFKTVIGASDMQELNNTLNAINAGPINTAAYEEILATFN